MRRLGIWVGAPVGGLEEDEAFCETTHNICVKIQQTTVAVTRVDILNDITSKILGEALPWMSPFTNIGGHVPPVPVWIDPLVNSSLLTQQCGCLKLLTSAV